VSSAYNLLMEGLGLESGERDLITLHSGRILQTHGPAQCAGQACCFHNPSEHPLNTRPLMWRADVRPSFMERICGHGVGHPDPDSLAFLIAVAVADPELRENVEALEIHGCDGCCRAMP
jgi:hypothetical protein